jgi:hypothetical protein
MQVFLVCLLITGDDPNITKRRTFLLNLIPFYYAIYFGYRAVKLFVKDAPEAFKKLK